MDNDYPAAGYQRRRLAGRKRRGRATQRGIRIGSMRSAHNPFSRRRSLVRLQGLRYALLPKV